MLRHVGVGANKQLLPVGDRGEARPDLLSGHHQLVAVDHCPGAQARQVGPGFGLGEALAPHDVAAQDRQQMFAALGVVAASDERRAGMAEPDEPRVDGGQPRARVLLVPDQLLGERQLAAAERFGPADAGPSGVVLGALPREVVGARFGEVVGATVAGHVLGQPGAGLVTEPVVCCREGEIHQTPSCRAPERLNRNPGAGRARWRCRSRCGGSRRRSARRTAWPPPASCRARWSRCGVVGLERDPVDPDAVAVIDAGSDP